MNTQTFLKALLGTVVLTQLSAAFAEEDTELGRKLIDTVVSTCRTKMMPNLQKQLPHLQAADNLSVCGCLQTQLTATIDPTRNYPRNQIGPLASKNFSECLTPAVKRSYQQECLQNTQQASTLKQKYNLSSKKYAQYCGCLANDMVSVKHDGSNGSKPQEGSQAETECVNRILSTKP